MRIIDSDDYELTPEEIKKEYDYYYKGELSFVCECCRKVARTNSYKKFKEKVKQNREDSKWKK